MLKITSVSKYKGMTYAVEFDDDSTEYLNFDTVSKYSLRGGMEIPKSAWEQIKEDEAFRKAKERALYLLDYRDYSYIELFKKLNGNYSEEICYAVMDKMVELGTINDKRYAQNLARRYVEVKGYGRYRALQEMRAKGLTKQVAEEALEQYEDSYYERLYQLIEKKYARKLLEDEDGKNTAKVKNALVRYGYSYDLIKEAVRDFIEANEEE